MRYGLFIDLRRTAASNRTITMQNSKLLRSLFPALFAVALLAQLVACGGGRGDDNDPPTTQPPTEQPPVAVIATSAERGEAPFTVELSGANSYDEDGSIVRYEWTFTEGEGETGSVIRRTFDQAGDYAITLTVTDNDGLSAQKTVTVTALAQGSRFRISGVISSLPYTDVDGDVNDPFADYFDNDGHTSANFQPLSNPVLLNGYATATQTGQLPDAFAFEADRHDIYSVDLAQGDYVSMQVVDYTEGDLDLLLFDGTSSTLVAALLSGWIVRRRLDRLDLISVLKTRE